MTLVSNPLVDSLLMGARILLVEDEWMISAFLVEYLHEVGCEVIGPAARIATAIDLASLEKIDCALLDLNVAGELVYPVAQILTDRSIPFAFTTGYGKAVISENFRDRPTLQKPFNEPKLSEILSDMLSRSAK
jgi:DNA-binding response OmpR family regulator